MSNIKEGALVKAWDDDPSDYVIGIYRLYDSACEIHLIKASDHDYFDNAIEVPPGLAKQLEELK